MPELKCNYSPNRHICNKNPLLFTGGDAVNLQIQVLLDDFFAIQDNNALEAVLHALTGQVEGGSVGVNGNRNHINIGSFTVDADKMAT